jgi:hypothetical protein
MSCQYEYPDDPAVFARVLQHFRNTPAAHWDALVERYSNEARAQSSAAEKLSATSDPTNMNAIRPSNSSTRKAKRTGGVR